VLDEQGTGYHGTGAAGTGEPGDCRQQMQKRTARSRTAQSYQDRDTGQNARDFLEFAMHTHCISCVDVATRPGAT
jgi:hypothetical protein